MTFFRLVWMAGITLAIVFFFGWLTKGRLSRVFKITFQILLASQLIFLSAGYGIMGKEYLYPAVKTDYKYNNKIVSDFPVIHEFRLNKILDYPKVNKYNIF
ncbi:MAG: hypothetical protein GY795_51125 [Desulfobacterales bacterium]|nr:hypothetical protein [Desulfobacterales bacterium]